MTRPGILFVDDEPNILHGLKRFTRSKRGAWNMHFVAGGAEALAIVRAEPIDVLVADMRMPGMDGAELMQCVSDEAPGVIRIILSGEADSAQAYRTVGRSHRFLAKPCDPATLVAMIEQLLVRRDDAGQTMSLRTSSFLDRLTSQPNSFVRLRQELDCEEPKAARVAEIIALDPSLAARILQLVNSAYFGRPVETFSIRHAVATLGLERIRELVDHGRLGRECDDNGAEERAPAQTCTPEKLAILARARVAEGGGSKDEQELAFAIGLFCRLGCMSDDEAQSERSAGCLADRSAVFATALLGLPEILTDRLSSLASARPDEMSKENCAELIFDVVLAKAGKAA